MKYSLLILNLLLAMSFVQEAQARRHHYNRRKDTTPQVDPLIRNDVVDANSPCEPGTPKLYCNMIIKILSDPNSCAGKAMAKIQELAKNNELDGMGLACKPFALLQDGISPFVRMATKVGQIENDWNPYRCGDGGRSCGLFQVSRTDGSNPNYGDCRPLMKDRKAIFQAEPNLRCGLCEMFADMPTDKALGEVRAERTAHTYTRNHRSHTYYSTRYVTLGAAHMFGPFYHRNQIKKKNAIYATTANYCQVALNKQYRDVASQMYTGTTGGAATN